MNGWILRNSTNQTLRSNSDTKTGREKIFPVFFFYITDNQLSLRSCHRHIKKPAFFFYFFVGSCFLVWAASLICFNHEYGIKLKSLCSMHCHQVYPFFFSVFLILFFQHFSITFNMFKPFFYGAIPLGVLPDFFEHCKKIFRRNLSVCCIFLQELIISHAFPYILNGCIRCLVTDHLHVPFQLIDSVNHPVFIPVISPE